MSYVVAFDPSTKVLGWACMDTDTGGLIGHGVEDITVPKDGGWQHDQVHRAVLSVQYICPIGEPDGWTYELPHAPGQRAAYAYYPDVVFAYHCVGGLAEAEADQVIRQLASRPR